MEMIRSTLQILNKITRKEELTEGDKAQLCRIKEVNDILMLFQKDRKEAGAQLDKYRADLTARLRSGAQPAPVIPKRRPEPELLEPAPRRARVAEPQKPTEQEEAYEPVSPDADELMQPEEADAGPKPILSLPPSGPPPRDFGISWLQNFIQQMCSKVPYFQSKNSLKAMPNKIIESSEEQAIFVDGMSPSDTLLLLNLVFDLESHIIEKRKSGKTDFSVPHRLGLLHRMPDPLDSGLLDSWYFSIPSQCATCALRFPNRKILTTHHDYHFVKNSASQRRRRGLDVAFRGWMETPQDYLGNRSIVLTRNFYRKLDPASSQKSEVTLVAKRGDKSLMDPQAALVDLLSHACPADDIKTRCFECDEPFDRLWIEDPVSLAVFPDSVCVPLFASQPIRFSWPSLEVSLDVEGGTTDATLAGEDHRFVNGLIFHEKCWQANPGLKKKDNQVDLVFELAEELEGKEARAVIQEEQEEEESQDEISGIPIAPRKYF